MADIISLLPDSVANQIAAGEVIQRPASAVKELLENAIDAGATSIKLIVKDAGRTLIQVIDNGKGMSATDARLCWERHATSKIKHADDLFAIRTMGFRGEALASIAAISQVEMKTRRLEDDLGTRIEIEGSEVVNQEHIQCPEGTSISMKNLFFNVPVRRNFLKSNSVEFRHIMDEFHRVALANPEIGLSLSHNDSDVYILKAAPLRQRIVAMFGNDYNERLVPIDESTSITTVSGFICKPEFARKTRGEQYFFVNNRFIKSTYLHHAVQSAYKDLLPQETFPTYFIYLQLDPKTVDINIHPTKTEIKFEDERAIYAILRSAVQRSLGRFNISPTLDFNQEASFAFPIMPPTYPVAEPKINVDPSFNPFESRSATKPRQTEMNHAAKSNMANWEKLYEGFERKEETSTLTPVTQKENEILELSHSFFQVHNTYIITQVKSGMMIIDQQAAHERVQFERFQSMLKNHTGVSQQLLFPATLEFNAQESTLVAEMLPALHALGVDIHAFGNNTFVVQGVAPYIQETNLKDLIDGLLHEYKQSNSIADKNITIARALARKTSIKKGQTLAQEEMEALVNDLFACEMSAISPSGKPVLFKLSLEELDKRFW